MGEDLESSNGRDNNEEHEEGAISDAFHESLADNPIGDLPNVPRLHPEDASGQPGGPKEESRFNSLSPSAQFGLQEGQEAYWFLLRREDGQKWALRPDEEVVEQAIDRALAVAGNPSHIDPEEAERALLQEVQRLKANGEEV